jgi:hypothetical protein
MEKPSTLRRKAARFFRNAASSTTTAEAEKLNEVGCQLELWADDLEEMQSQAPHDSTPGESDQREPTNS